MTEALRSLNASPLGDKPGVACVVERRAARHACFRSVQTSARSRAIALKALKNTVETKILQIAGNFVTTPTNVRPKGVVHFLGGAFAGAAPQIAYQFLINWMADAGYTVVSTPYSITFRHLDCAARVNQAFQDTLFELRQTGRDWMVPQGVPLHGVGHSNGALLHLMIGSRFGQPNRSNVAISYNNKEVKEAIPIPLENLQEVIRSARSSSLPAVFPTTEAILEGAIALSAATQGVLDRETAFAFKPALDQIGEVLDEVGNGFTDFVPAPAESRRLICSSYRVPETLLLQFSDDGIDETALIAPGLRQSGQDVVVAKIPGSHVTPCGSDSNWQVGRVFTPLDAVSLAAKAVLQTDLRRAARKVVQWLDAKS